MPSSDHSLTANAPLKNFQKSWPAFSMREISQGEACSLTALNGAEEYLRQRFQEAFGSPLPEPGGAVAFEDGYAFWTAPEQYFLFRDISDPFHDATLAEKFGSDVAVTLQSDAWVRVALEGDATPRVLERLIAMDLSGEAFAAGHAVRTMMGHLNVFVVRLIDSPMVFRLWCARSFARSFIHEIVEAADNVC